jgi:hypothetical protein
MAGSKKGRPDLKKHCKGGSVTAAGISTAKSAASENIQLYSDDRTTLIASLEIQQTARDIITGLRPQAEDQPD